MLIPADPVANALCCRNLVGMAPAPGIHSRLKKLRCSQAAPGRPFQLVEAHAYLLPSRQLKERACWHEAFVLQGLD